MLGRGCVRLPFDRRLGHCVCTHSFKVSTCCSNVAWRYAALRGRETLCRGKNVDEGRGKRRR